ncbi:MAG: hypothetical protein JNM84_01850 [Planctomycetes bacterium]|nr:hypothetical protein [Planctomycetota bacterium]
MPNPTDSQPSATFTGRQRRRRTARAVVLADHAAKFCVHLGGYGTIAAVLVMAFFFLSVVLPLFTSGRVESVGAPAMRWNGAAPLALGTDEYQRLGWAVLPEGVLEVFDLEQGRTVERYALGGEGRTLRAASAGERGGELVFGFSDGSVQIATIGFEVAYRERSAFEGRFAALEGGAGAVVEWREPTPDGSSEHVLRGWVEGGENRTLRLLQASLALSPLKSLGSAPVTRIDHTVKSDNGVVVAALLGEGVSAELVIVTARVQANLTSGEEELRFGRVLRPARPAEHASELPLVAHVVGQGGNVLLVHESGLALRYKLESGKEPRVLETCDLAPEDGERVATTAFLLGGETLLVGGSGGRVSGWFLAPIEPGPAGFEVLAHGEQNWLFRAGSPALAEFRRTGERASFVEREGAALNGGILRAPDEKTMAAWLALRTDDGFRYVSAKQYRAHGSGPAIAAFAPSPRGRVFACADASGEIRLLHGTSEKEIAVFASASGAAPGALAITPKENGLCAAGASGIERWAFDPGFAGITLGTLFRPVWYENYPTPIHMWQSSAGEDSAEPKLGLWPLVFGTLKATLYSMLIAVPLALLAAIFTSEFLSARAKARVKPTIELMASLPSVVLGFLAALVFAPFVEQHLAGIFATFFALPLCLLLGAFLWQLLPRDYAAKKAGYRLPLMALVALPLSLGAGLLVVGPLLDAALFDGGLRYWLDGSHQVPVQGSPFGGWLFLSLPFSGLAVAWAGGWLARRSTPPVSHRAQALRSLLAFAGGLALAALLAAGAAALLSSLGDLRGAGSVIDTYDTRNALVVGFVMGFAIVPIVYTIAEDALSSVPGHLRGASLGAGATTWQTAVRVVIPTAMSGLFSACMIGLGRAVGETMIVLMAAGSTPVLDLNLFNGFRTLSANIATELPEAVQGSAHYRTLFLAALVLFAMTFVLNSVAESVRQRFRKRAFEL